MEIKDGIIDCEKLIDEEWDWIKLYSPSKSTVPDESVSISAIISRDFENKRKFLNIWKNL
jgi:hypothetical protein